MTSNAQRALLEHPIFDALRYHEQIKLTETSDPFPQAFNPHFGDRVEYRMVSAAAGTQANGKAMMALQAFYEGIERGLVTKDTTVVEASSGNTGPEMLKVAMELGISMTLILKRSMPREKLDRACVLCDDTVKTLIVPNKVAQLAREMGAAPHFCNPDQYNPHGWNKRAQGHILAPQVFGEHSKNKNAAAIFVLGGSCGTPLGFAEHAKTEGLRTQVHMVAAAGHDDISGGKNIHQIKSDILYPEKVFEVFPEETILRAPREKANFLTWLSWQYVVKRSHGLRFMCGQSTGANIFAAFDWVEARKQDGTLDRYRGQDEKVVILIYCMDTYEGYANLLMSEMKEAQLELPRELPPLAELLQFERTA